MIAKRVIIIFWSICNHQKEKHKSQKFLCLDG